MSDLVGNLNAKGTINGGINLPKGDKGDQGVSGVYVGSGDMPEGYNVQVDPTSEAKGVFPDLTIGVVETLEAGENATASVTGPDDAPVLNLGIPKGDRGVQGEQGMPGVYVGEGDMPEGYSVQVNPNGDVSLVKGYELIAKGETPEAVQQFIVDKDAEGNSFDLRDFVWIYVEIPIAAQDTRLSIWYDSFLQQINSGVSKSSSRVNKLILFHTGFNWDSVFSTTAKSNENNTLSTNFKSVTDYAKGNSIKSFKIGCYNAGDTLPIGTKYWIYGRKA